MALTFCFSFFSHISRKTIPSLTLMNFVNGVVYWLQGQFLRRAAGFLVNIFTAQRCVNTVNVYRCSRGDTGTFSFFFSAVFFSWPFPCDTRTERLLCAYCVYFWKHFKVICAPTKKAKKKKDFTLRKRNDVPTHSIKLRGERRRGEADSKANAGLVGVLNMN